MSDILLIINQSMSLKDRTIKQIQALFPKLSIKSQQKRLNFGNSLIKIVQCPVLSTKSMKVLIDAQSNVQSLIQFQNQEANILLKQLQVIMSTWLKVLENNQQTRQQYQEYPLNSTSMNKYQTILKNCQAISSKKQFLSLISKNSDLIFGEKSVDAIDNYREAYVINSIESYNTISNITQDQYLSYFQQMVEKIVTMVKRLSQFSTQLSADSLRKFLVSLRGEELFFKNDNKLNRTIKFVAMEADQLSRAAKTFQREIVGGRQNILQASFISYYLCFLAKKDIAAATTIKEATKILHFLCDRQNQVVSVYPKLYQRKIIKALLRLNHKFQELNNIKDIIYKPQLIDIKQDDESGVELKIEEIMKQTQKIRSIYQNSRKPLSQQAFQSMYGNIQEFCQSISPFIDSPYSENIKKKVQNLVNTLNKLQADVIQSFIHISPNERKRYSKGIKNNNKRISIRSTDRLSKQIRQQQDLNIFNDSSEQYTQGEPTPVEIINDQIKNYLQKTINPVYSQFMEDKVNFNVPYLKKLIKDASNYKIQTNDLEYLKIFSQITKQSISHSRISQIFTPTIRTNIFKTYNNKIAEHAYKLTKILSEIQTQMNQQPDPNRPNLLQTIPYNLLDFIKNRQYYIKTIQNNLQKILQILQFVSKIQLNSNKGFQITQKNTYNYLLKGLIAIKQLNAYLNSDYDSIIVKNPKKIPSNPKALIFLADQIYKPILKTLQTQFFDGNKKLLQSLLQTCEKSIDLYYQTQTIMQNYTQYIQRLSASQRSNTSEIKSSLKQFVDNLRKHLVTFDLLLSKRVSLFNYQQLDRQKIRVQEFIEISEAKLNNQNINRRSIVDTLSNQFLNALP